MLQKLYSLPYSLNNLYISRYVGFKKMIYILCKKWMIKRKCVIGHVCSANDYKSSYHYSTRLGGCPFHGRVERDEIPTRESPPKQSGTRWTE